jgi:hypothetical protein
MIEMSREQKNDEMRMVNQFNSCVAKLRFSGKPLLASDGLAWVRNFDIC